MNFSFSKEVSSSAYTSVENYFISEYLPASSGDAVRVYLYGLFLCNNPQIEIELSEFASRLSLDENVVLDCFKYWEEFGLVSILSNEPLNVSYLAVKDAYAGKPRKYKAEKYADFTKGLQVMLPSRMISTNEYAEYFNVMDEYHIKPEAMLLIIKYCIDKKGEDIKFRYISKVARDFGDRGITTLEKVEKELSSYVLRTAEIEKILRALSSKRQPEIDDLKLYKKWTQELNFEPENIVFAASKLKKSSMEKLDEFMTKLYANKSFSKEEIASYLSSQKSTIELAVKINKALAIYVEVLDTEIDAYINKWLSYGYDESTLIFIASVQFKTGRNSLSEMDEMIEDLRTKGVIDLSSVNDYFESVKNQDEFIKKLLSTVGVNRRPTPWDRQNLQMWRSWNFSNEMILEAGKLSAGKSSPLAYVNGVLSNWKKLGVFSVEETQISSEVATTLDSQEEYNREYERRRSLAAQKASKNYEIAVEIEGVSDLLSRLNELERDLAFAEISNDSPLLSRLENEQATITKNVNKLLSKRGLTLDDLSPKYVCEKCKDTGYVGTHRCDCFSKTK
ncbi:MAG: DnaD domain protein [Clostridia bacterium]|nr:DnaD domain protein [Clostridia bacterium]